MRSPVPVPVIYGYVYHTKNGRKFCTWKFSFKTTVFVLFIVFHLIRVIPLFLYYLVPFYSHRSFYIVLRYFFLYFSFFVLLFSILYLLSLCTAAWSEPSPSTPSSAGSSHVLHPSFSAFVSGSRYICMAVVSWRPSPFNSAIFGHLIEENTRANKFGNFWLTEHVVAFSRLILLQTSVWIMEFCSHLLRIRSNL